MLNAILSLIRNLTIQALYIHARYCTHIIHLYAHQNIAVQGNSLCIRQILSDHVGKVSLYKMAINYKVCPTNLISTKYSWIIIMYNHEIKICNWQDMWLVCLLNSLQFPNDLCSSSSVCSELGGGHQKGDSDQYRLP